jgi:hypothetical protein
MSTEVIARIDVSKPAGRKIVKSLEKEKSVKLEYPLPESIAGQKKYTIDEAFEKCYDVLSKNYAVDVRKL